MKNGKIRRIRDNIELGESKGEDWGGYQEEKSVGERGKMVGDCWLGGGGNVARSNTEK